MAGLCRYRGFLLNCNFYIFSYKLSNLIWFFFLPLLIKTKHPSHLSVDNCTNLADLQKSKLVNSLIGISVHICFFQFSVDFESCWRDFVWFIKLSFFILYYQPSLLGLDSIFSVNSSILYFIWNAKQPNNVDSVYLDSVNIFNIAIQFKTDLSSIFFYLSDNFYCKYTNALILQYLFSSYFFNKRLIMFFKVFTDINSISTVYSNSKWLERELREFTNIYFCGLRDTRKLLLNYTTQYVDVLDWECGVFVE